MLLAALLATTASIVVPIGAASAQDASPASTQRAQAAPTDEHWAGERGGRPEHGMRGGMMHHMMIHRSPQERCEERLAWRAAMRAYTEAKLNLTSEQRPLWDRVQNIAQTEEQKERQLCSTAK